MLVELWGILLLKRVISQGFDDANHLGDWHDDDASGVILEHQRAGSQHETRENCSHELQHGRLLRGFFDADAYVGDQFSALRHLPRYARVWGVHQQYHLVTAEVAIIFVRNDWS